MDAMSDERDGIAGVVLATEVDETGPAPREKMGIEAKEAGAGTDAVMDTGAEAAEPAAREGESAGKHGQIADAAVAGFECRWQ